MTISARSLLVLAMLLLASCEMQDESVYTGFRGEAKRNPLLAAERTLERLGLDVESAVGSVPGSPGFESAQRDRERILVTGALPYSVDGPALRDLLAWIESGGDVIVCLDGFEGIEDEDPFDDEDESSDLPSPWDRPPTALMRGLGFERVRAPRWSDEVSIDGLEADFGRPGGWLQAEGGEPEPWLEFELGEGRVRVLTNGAPFNNHFLADHDHARLLYEWTRKAPGVLVALHADTTMASLLAERAPEALWAALALLLVWLWSAGARFGPIEPLPAAAVHGFTRHVAASGRFLWRQDRGPLLVSALRRRTLRLIERRFPASRSDQRSAVVEAVALRTRRSADDVHDLLYSGEALRPRDLVRLVRELVRLHREL